MIRVACLGAGYFSQFHYESWARMDGARAVAACDRDSAKADAIGLTVYTDLADMLQAETPDLLDIIVPPPGHAEAIRTALAHGVRWIICQKPFCENLDEARALTDEAEAAGATLIVHENFRFQPWFREIKRALDDGRIGAAYQCGFRLRPGDGQGPDAYLNRQPYFQTMPRFLIHETGVHFIDVFRFLFGDPDHAYADLRRLNPVIAGEDAGFFLLDHPNGVRTLFDGNRLMDHVADNHRLTMGEALIEGEAGALTLAGDGSVAFRAKGSKTSEQVLGADTGRGFAGDCVHALQSHVIAAMNDQGALENTAREYLEVIEIEAALYRSAEEGQKVSLR
ncbi:MAG: Gfo/Idh/MocA family oxidoreductase [Pseudomonadota bacterium]